MESVLLRPAVPGDAAEMVRLWETVFHDPAPLVRRLLTKGGLLDHAVVAESEGNIVSQMFAFPGLSVGGCSAAYLYALGTLPEFRDRGLGAAVLDALTRHCFDDGAELVFLSPADAVLTRWYQKLGFAPLCAMSDVPVTLTGGPVGDCAPVNIIDYVNFRNGGCTITLPLMTAQAMLAKAEGGGLFRLTLSGGEALACVQPTVQGLRVIELLCPKVFVAEALCTLAAEFPQKALWLRSPGGDTPLLYRSRGASVPSLSEGFCFPFIMD